MFVAGILGMLLYSLRKVKGIRKRMRKDITFANYTWKQVFIYYFQHEVISMIISVLVILTAMFLSKEWFKLPAEETTSQTTWGFWMNKAVHLSRSMFFLIGFCGNSIADAFAGKTEAMLDKLAKDKPTDDDI